MKADTIILMDHNGREIRLTAERQEHILEHPEMAQQLEAGAALQLQHRSNTNPTCTIA